MNKKTWLISTLTAVLLSLFGFASVAGAAQTNTPTPGLGLQTPKSTPKSTLEPTEFPFFFGDLDNHTGHNVRKEVLESTEYTHTICEYCSDCHMTIGKYTESHTLDAEGHCTQCNYLHKYCEQEHAYRVTRANVTSEQHHNASYECEICHHQIQVENEPHKEVQLYLKYSDENHIVLWECAICGYRSLYYYAAHRLDPLGFCKDCGYREGEPDLDTMLPEKAFGTVSVFCHLTANGKEIPCGYELLPSEDGETYNAVFLPENIPDNTALELRFTASELETLRAIGVERVYIRLNDIDMLLLGDIKEVSGETVFTLMPSPEGIWE